MSVSTSIKTLFQNLVAKLRGVEAQGSAFIKIAEADAKALEAKGRIVAIDAANKVKTEVVEFLEKEATRVHADADKIKADFDAILAKL
jgi:hypothetical protein